MSRRRFVGALRAALGGAITGLAFPRFVFAQNKKPVKFALAWVAEGTNLFCLGKNGLDVDIARGSGSVAAA